MIACFFDFDSTVVTKESLDEVINVALANHPEQSHFSAEVERLTNLGMEGKIPFTQSVDERLKFCPVEQHHFEYIGTHFLSHITPGFETMIKTLQQKDCEVFIVSGGFLPSIYPVAEKLNIPRHQVYANEPLFGNDGNCLGANKDNLLWTNEGKSPVIEYLKEKHQIKTSILVGDGNNDFRAFERGSVDHFIGFGGNVVRESVKANAPIFTHSTEELEAQLNQII